MKNNYLLLTLLFLLALPYSSLAQGIVFESGTWADAVKKAKKQKKLLFLHFDQPSCGSCSEVASVAFNSPLIKEKFMLNFISFRIDGSTGIGKELVEKVEAECIPSSVYLDADENPLARFCGTSSLDRSYLEKAEEAITKNREQPLKALADAYAKGDRSSKLMRTYIDRRREAGLSTTELLDTYVQQLPADSLRSAAVLRFIFEQAPIVGSKADSVFRRDYPRTDSLYRAVGWNKAVELNNRIVNNSLKKAIKEKNELLAFKTAGFRQRTYQNDYKNGVAAREWVMLRYFRGVNDTLHYLSRASYYFDNQFMTAKVDSIQNLDNLDNQRRMRGTMPVPMSGATVKPGQTSTSFILNPNTQRYVSALNNAAWEFYNMTRDTVYLKKALEWSKRTLEYREDGTSMDTYAHLLYRLGRKSEALEWQEKAVRLEQERQSPLVTSLRKSLDQMKAGTL
jgi:tetratricopeptide (TPR) repeat protein